MNIPVKTLQNGFSLPVYGLGTWQMGGRTEADTTNDTNEIKAIRDAIEMGVTHIDTAETYAVGHSEELVGEAISHYDRNKIFLVSKVNKLHLKYDDLIAAAKESLRRLKTDYLDLYLIHSPSLEIPIEESMRALDHLKEIGLIKEIGVSNFSVERFEAAQKCTQNKIVTNQVHLNLISREPQHAGIINYCQTHDVLLTAYRPVNKGLLTTIDNPLMQKLCEKYEKTPAQIAINWLIGQDNIVTLAKTSQRDHLLENLKALDWQLDTDDVKLLTDNYPNQETVSTVNPLR